MNPAILGGVVVKIGDTVMDGSVRKRLALLSEQDSLGSRVARENSKIRFLTVQA